MHKFSVSMCVYAGDKPQWFLEAVNSVVNQTVKPNEIVIVVDGPIPEKLDNIITNLEKDSLFKIIRLEKNQGHGNARRIGLSQCSHDIVALMDADDICLPNRFEEQLKIFESDDELSIVGGQISEFIDDPSKPISYRNVPIEDEKIKSFMKKRCPMNQPSVMFKKTDVEKVGGYIDWFCNEDYYLWIRMALANMKMQNSSSVLVNMRTTADSYRRRGGFKYFKSERKLQKFMLAKNIISYPTYLSNIFKRFVVQVLLPNRMRGWVFKKLARS